MGIINRVCPVLERGRKKEREINKEEEREKGTKGEQREEAKRG